MQHFPSIFELAAAPQQDVLTIWEGLGYYARARNLHQAAQTIVADYGGQLPSSAAALEQLPGIGRYTAAAIASIAFGEDAAALDGNIRRVLARVFNVAEPARSTTGERILWQLAEAHLPTGKASEYNQALMDLGATICTPSTPDCEHCPVANLCQANALNIQDQRPVTKPKAKIPHHTVTAAILQKNGKVFIAQRPDKGLLGGMWEFPGGKTEPGETLQDCLKREICEELNLDIQVGSVFGIYEHAFTHFRITLHAFKCQLIGTNQPKATEHTDLRWVEFAELSDYPMGKIDRQIAEKLSSTKNE
jgi:A/G-specific adenine glycosylase